MPDLVLFTIEFPYGVENETFLEAEIPILAEQFDRVLVLPSHARETMRPVPGKVEVVRMGWTVEPSTAAKLAAVASTQALKMVWWSLGTPSDLFAHVRSPRRYIDVLGRNILKYRELRALIRDHDLSNAVFYDYWFENSTIALALLRQEDTIRIAVARAHGFDVYDEEWDARVPGGRPPPFRQAKGLGLDAVFPASNAIEHHLHAQVPALRTKMATHHLGVIDPGTPTPSPETRIPALIVTCATFQAKKRLELVPDVLAALTAPFRWVHIGSGATPIEAAAQRMLPPGSFTFLGPLSNQGVHDFYRTNSVQCLLSVSTSEAVPVTMMEALSYGIPIVACDAGGVREIVNERTGVMVPLSATVAEIANGIEACLAREFDPDAVRVEWAEHFDATVNHERFARALLSLRS